MENNYNHYGLLVFSSTFSLNVMASDFNVLTVGLSASIIAVVLVFIGIKGFSAARTKPRNEVAAYSFSAVFLVLVGLALVFEEAVHMADADVYGLVAVIVIPGFLAIIFPLVLSKPVSDDSNRN